MIQNKSLFFMALLIMCTTACTRNAAQHPNIKIEIRSTVRNTSENSILKPLDNKPLIPEENVTAEHVSPYPADVHVNLNDENIEEKMKNMTMIGTFPINVSMYEILTSSTNEPETQTISSPTNLSVLVSHGIYDLGQKIISKLLNNNNNNKQDVKSEVISPLSIAGVGYLLYLGATGRTEDELAGLLGLSKSNKNAKNQKEIHLAFSRLLDDIVIDKEMNNDDKEYPEYISKRVHTISVANAIFLNNHFSLRPQYANVVQNVYKSEVQRMDFAREGLKAKTFIDNWVSNQTHGKIPTILESPPTENTQMIVVSALYFKALWWEELGVQTVMKQPFYPNGENTEPIDVDTIMFASELLPYYESKKLNCRIFGLRYQKQISTMYIVQPLISNRKALIDFQNDLTSEMLEGLIKKMNYVHVSILAFPKFHLESQTNLKHIFHQLGVQSLFAGANLSPISPNRFDNIKPNLTDDLDYLDYVRRNSRFTSNVAISEIHHKVNLVVNERGTEGGAATAAVVDRIAARYMKIDTPFIFVIRQDITKLPLFYGTVFEPEQD